MSGQKYYVWLALLCCSLSVQVQAGQKVKTPMHFPNTPDAVARPFMQRIPAGDFLMGSPPSEESLNDDDGPQRRIQVAAFELGEKEVTVGQFRAFTQATGYQRSGCTAYFTQSANHPVVCVSWADTQAYIEWLNQQTGQQYRLPSEAEWEYAARAGSQTPFAFGECLHTDQANYDGRYDYADCGAQTGVYRRGTVAVDALQAANAWGLRHMHGNAWEWVQDCWHDSYDGAPSDGRAWQTGDCARRVLRGGSWDYGPNFLRVAYRLWDHSVIRANDVGFRLARTF